MVSKLLAIAIASLLGWTACLAQSDNALVDKSRQAPAVPEAPARALTPEERGDILMARKMYREAIETFQTDPHKNAILYNKIGIAYHQLQQLDNARKYYERALKENPQYPEALNNLGTIAYARKSYRKAIRYYKKALVLSPKSASIYSNLGTAFFARRKYKEATAAYQQALVIDPDVFEHRSNFGTMLEDRNIEERAKFHYYLAKIYAKAGRDDLAMQYVRKALEEGFKDRNKLKDDPEFETLRKLPEFQTLMTVEPRVL